jgi:hypothetical protein
MADTTTNEKTREAIARRDWLTADGKPINPGEEHTATAFRYIHLPSARAAKADYDPDKDAPISGTYFTFDCGKAGDASTMLAIFGGLTLAGNIVNTATKGPKGDPNADVIAEIEARFDDIRDGAWGVERGGPAIRFDRETLAKAIAAVKGETDHTPYLPKMALKVDPKTGATVANDTKGSVTYGYYAMQHTGIKAKYNELAGIATTNLAAL